MKSFEFTIDNFKIGMPSIAQKVGIALFALCFVATGCAIIKSKKDTNMGLGSTAIVGRVNAKSVETGPIIVAACSTSEGNEIVHYSVLHDSGEYELMVDQGNYYIFAYWDKNSNLIYEAGEPAGQYNDPKVVSVPAVGVLYDINIVIPEEGQNIEISHGTKIKSVVPQKLQSRQAGAIVNLDDERFSEEYGIKGFWEPFAFFKEIGGNVFFLEEYDPKKTPILFIHGATGTPKGWKYFANNIDRTRFQPWFFYYPTGARINTISYLLFWKLSNLQTKYKFNKIHIAAHSMGGLVAKSFITYYGQVFPYVKLFVSLATPWGGDKMAEYGVEQSPMVIPSWIDMQPNGDFIESLYRKKMPESISFYMFYGHRGTRNPLRSNNDGTITLSSLLDYRSQSEAKMNYAFNEDHASIIYSKDALAQFKTILNEFDTNQNESLHRSGGYLKVHYAYSYDFDGVRTWPTLILSPVGKNDADTITFLSGDDNGKILGPFPMGDYFANMVTMAGKTVRKNVPFTIESNKTSELEFVLTPDGEIIGCITASMKPEDKNPGMPENFYRSHDGQIEILTIALIGNGIYRELQQIEGEDVYDYDYLISRADFCYNRCFGFFNLPEGDYNLIIKAHGYQPIIKNYSVIPGIPNYFRPTELKPD